MSNPILLTNVFAADFDDPVQHKQKWLYINMLDRFFIAEECWIFSCILLYRRDLLFLQPEVYLLHFLVWKGFYICYK